MLKGGAAAVLTSEARWAERADLLSLQEYCDGAVVDECYVHHSAEAACLDRVDAGRAQPLTEVVEEACGLLGRGRPDEAGAFTPACVREEGELRDGEGCSPDVSDTAVHLSLFVGHDPQFCYLLGQPVRFGFAVSLRDADQQEETWAYAGDPLSRDRDGGFFDALEDYAQGL